MYCLESFHGQVLCTSTLCLFALYFISFVLFFNLCKVAIYKHYYYILLYTRSEQCSRSSKEQPILSCLFHLITYMFFYLCCSSFETHFYFSISRNPLINFKNVTPILQITESLIQIFFSKE